jgi:hypothetical protein
VNIVHFLFKTGIAGRKETETQRRTGQATKTMSNLPSKTGGKYGKKETDHAKDQRDHAFEKRT